MLIVTRQRGINGRQSRSVNSESESGASSSVWHYSALDSRVGVGVGTLWLGRQSAGFLIKRFLHLALDLSEFTASGYYKEGQFLSLNSPTLLKNLQGFQLPAAQKSHSPAFFIYNPCQTWLYYPSSCAHAPIPISTASSAACAAFYT